MFKKIGLICLACALGFAFSMGCGSKPGPVEIKSDAVEKKLGGEAKDDGTKPGPSPDVLSR